MLTLSGMSSEAFSTIFKAPLYCCEATRRFVEDEVATIPVKIFPNQEVETFDKYVAKFFSKPNSPQQNDHKASIKLICDFIEGLIKIDFDIDQPNLHLPGTYAFERYIHDLLKFIIEKDYPSLTGNLQVLESMKDNSLFRLFVNLAINLKNKAMKVKSQFEIDLKNPEFQDQPLRIKILENCINRCNNFITKLTAI